jgi:UPF0716 family protein affecting phage T7 exclusion
MLRNALALVAGSVLLVLGFMFSVILITVVAGLGLVVWGWLMWKTRKARRAMREQAQAGGRDRGGAGGQVIDGEAVVVEEYHVRTTQTLPRNRPGDPEP